jgi:hypothetical protein
MGILGGAALWLPEPGELGVVGVLLAGYYVWLGSLPFQEKNQVDPTKDIYYLRHQSGVVVQIRPNGDHEIIHPSGSRISISQDGGALPVLQTKNATPQIKGNTSPPTIEISHPSGGMIQIDGDGHLNVEGFASVTFQAGDKRFCMDTLVDRFNSHTHPYIDDGSPMTTSGPTTALVKNEVCSPATFLGPEGA